LLVHRQPKWLSYFCRLGRRRPGILLPAQPALSGDTENQQPDSGNYQMAAGVFPRDQENITLLVFIVIHQVKTPTFITGRFIDGGFSINNGSVFIFEFQFGQVMAGGGLDQEQYLGCVEDMPGSPAFNPSGIFQVIQRYGAVFTQSQAAFLGDFEGAQADGLGKVIFIFFVKVITVGREVFDFEVRHLQLEIKIRLPESLPGHRLGRLFLPDRAVKIQFLLIEETAESTGQDDDDRKMGDKKA